MSTKTDFWSPSYWSTRFTTESNFEWLVPSSTLVPIVCDIVSTLPPPPEIVDCNEGPEKDGECSANANEEKEGEVLNILHLGSGTSILGTQLQTFLDSSDSTPKCQVYDADYVPLPSSTESEQGRVPFKLVDALSPISLFDSLPSCSFSSVTCKGGRGGRGGRLWDMVLDKSTIDAISTGPLFPPSQYGGEQGEEELPLDPAERTLLNVGRVVRRGGKWVSVSYSSSRYDFLASSSSRSLSDGKDVEQEGKFGWRVVRKEIVAMTSLPEGRLVRDGRGERIVYEPETGIWLYVLERV
ncbi:hypothetical protein IAR50_002475 [Cryptococcus sp. DSM 104548]